VKRKLIALSVATSISITKETKEQWLTIGTTGKWEGHSVGSFAMDSGTFSQMVENFKNSGVDIVVDYEHQTLTGEIAPASGWIAQGNLKTEEGNLLAKISWTEKAKGMIDGGEYRYLSPVYAPNTTRQQDGANIGWTLHSVALTNKPFLEDLSDLMENNDDLVSNKKNLKGETMTEEEKQEMEELRAQNKALLDAQAQEMVDNAIALKKIAPDQKESALKMCKADVESFKAFLDTAKPLINLPPNNVFPNTNPLVDAPKTMSIDANKF
jgi:phage I-like protein